MNKIAITGATGMIGASLVRCAIEKGIEVVCIARGDSERLGNIPQSDLVRIVHCDISEYDTLDVQENCDVFYHFAWANTYGSSRDDVNAQTDNIRYTLDAVRLSTRMGCKKFVGAGSQAEYGITDKPLGVETQANPQSAYGMAKYAAGKLSGVLCAQLGLQFNWVRILSVFGPLDSRRTLVMYAMGELLAGRSPELTKCEQIWDYLYCDDAARAFIAIGKNGASGKFYPLGSGDCKRLSEYVEIIKSTCNPAVKLRFGQKEYFPYQPMHLYADISELTADTGWKPEVSFAAGINRLINV